MTRNFSLKLITWLAVVIVAVAILSPGLSGGFFFDDEPNLVRNEAIQIEELSPSSLFDVTKGPTAGPLGRPISVASFAATYYFFGLDPYAFKTINLILHIINGLLVGWFVTLLLQLFKLDIPKRYTLFLPAWVSAIWLLHPINVLPIFMAVQRMTLLSGMFLLLALIYHCKAILATGNIKRIFYMASWVLFWPLAIFSKETGLLFPLYIFSLAIFLPGGPGKNKRILIISASVVALIGLVMTCMLGGDWLKHAYTMRPFSLAERLLTESRVLWFYAAQILAPDYTAFAVYLDDFSISKNIWSPPSTLLSIAGWITTLGAAYFWHKRLPFLGFAVMWFLIGHSLESSFLPLEIAHEYRNYIPSIGLIIGVGYLGTIGLQKITLDYKKTTIAIVSIFPILILSLFTWMRANQLSDPVLGPQMEASRHPLSARANYAAALTLFQNGYGDAQDPLGGKQIEFYFLQAGQADASFKHGYLGLITWSCASGREVHQEWINEFASRLEQTNFSPNDRELPNEILKILLKIPACLDRKAALDIFIAGAANRTIDGSLKAKFYEAASDYELLVSLNPVSAREYLIDAVSAFPKNAELKNKLRGFHAIDN